MILMIQGVVISGVYTGVISVLHSEAGVNIFRNSPRIIGEKFSNFLGSGEEFDEIQSRACFCNLGWESVNYFWETFLNLKRNSTKIKCIVSHHEGELNANYPKMSRFTHNFREKIEDLRNRHWGKYRHEFGKCAPLNFGAQIVKL